MISLNLFQFFVIFSDFSWFPFLMFKYFRWFLVSSCLCYSRFIVSNKYLLIFSLKVSSNYDKQIRKSNLNELCRKIKGLIIMLKLLVKQSEKTLIIKILEYTFTLFVLNKWNNMGHTFWIHQNPCDVLILHPQISQYGYFQISSTIFKIQPFMSYFKLKGLEMFWPIVLKLAKNACYILLPYPQICIHDNYQLSKTNFRIQPF